MSEQVDRNATSEIMCELTAHDGSTTALLSNILRCWSSEKMRSFAEALLWRCPQDDWKADTWLGAHDIAETELPRILSGWCKQPGLAAVIANYAIKVAQRHKACSEAVSATPPVCKRADTCRRCGGTAKHEQHSGGHDVICQGCGARGVIDHETKSEAWLAWITFNTTTRESEGLDET